MEQPPALSGTEPSPANPLPTSLPARLLNVFATPSEVFDEVKHSPPSVANWLAPALLLILVSWVGAWFIFSQETIKHQLTELTDKAIQAQIEKAKIPPEQAEKMRQFGELSTKIATFAGPVVVAFVSPFVWGFIIWLVGGKALHGSFSYMKAVEVVGLGNTIGVLDSVIRILLILVSGNLFAAPSLVLLVKEYDPNNTVHSLLALLNVMTIWLLAVRSIGLARVSGAPVAKAATWVFGIWLAYNGLFAGLGLAMKAAFHR
jgi:hypothetical protein